MGGPGSGNRSRRGASCTTDDCRSIDVRRWAREGMLWPGYQGSWEWTRNGETVASIDVRTELNRVVLEYRNRRWGGIWREVEEPVCIERTPCHLGGTRPWFLCPNLGCGRRVAILYCRGTFACRRCHRITYASSNEGDGDRAARRALRIRARLSWDATIMCSHAPKPKWMRWRTYDRLLAEHEALLSRSLQTLAQQFGLVGMDS